MIAQQAANRSLCMLVLGSRQRSSECALRLRSHICRGQQEGRLRGFPGYMEWCLRNIRISAALRKPGVESKRRVPMQRYVRTAYYGYHRAHLPQVAVTGCAKQSEARQAALKEARQHTGSDFSFPAISNAPQNGSSTTHALRASAAGPTAALRASVPWFGPFAKLHSACDDRWQRVATASPCKQSGHMSTSGLN